MSHESSQFEARFNNKKPQTPYRRGPLKRTPNRQPQPDNKNADARWDVRGRMTVPVTEACLGSLLSTGLHLVFRVYWFRMVEDGVGVEDAVGCRMV